MGCRQQHANRLRNLKVKNAYDFTQLPDAWVRDNMSVVGLRLKHDLQGIPTLDFEDVKPKKNIATTRSFEGMIKDLAASLYIPVQRYGHIFKKLLKPSLQ